MAVDEVLDRMKKIFDFDPRTQDGLVSITTWLLIVIYFLCIHLFIVHVNLEIYKPNYALYLFVLFVPAAVGLLIFSGDPITQSASKDAQFFQGQFPDAYIAGKFKVDISLARLLWFKAIDKISKEGFIQRTFERGYTCRLVYYTRRASILFALLGFLTLAVHIGWRYWTVVVYRSAGLRGVLPAASAEENWLGKLFYLAHILALWAYLTFWNKPDAHRPTGVWARWKEINDRNKAWINEKFKTLDELKSFVGL